jgi:CRISPR/Cas system CMR subunit Cmr6 (Cas7 group RAMP superfamily)
METKVDSVPNPESSASGENQDDKVAYSTYKRVLAEAKKFKELADSLSKQTEAEKEKQLKDQNEWKSLAEMHKAKLDVAQKELEEKNRAISDGLKFSEFNRHLGGKLKHSSYANHVDFDRILINPETGMIEESSVKTVVAEFIKQHSALVDFGNKPRLPNEAPRHGLPSGKKSIEEMTSKEMEQHILEQAKLGLIK